MPDPHRVFPRAKPSRSFKPVGLAPIGALMLMMPSASAADLPAPAATTPTGLEPAPSVDQFTWVSEKLANWKVVLGGGAMVAPKFEGSDEYEVSPIPFVSAAVTDWMMLDPRGVALGVRPLDGLPNFKVAARLGYDPGRQQDDSDHLRGLGDIDAGAVVGARVAYLTGPVEVYAAVDRTFGGSDGLQARLGAEGSWNWGRFFFTLGASATWADETYMSAYFGVTPIQSLRSHLPVYDLGAGIKRIDVSASVTYMMSDHWLIRGQAGLGTLVGDAGDSPIVQSRTQPSGMLSIGYKF
ncbi:MULTISPECIES: MipA/OmpV family protein [unclassified Xanthobacter]|uniref:MipA/OmpV family protein n=1 Tax=unclassified Xanthobacter TaxID=2623496 RepID=UPI001EDCB315|nr:MULTISPECIES: MipA/OmpV family protein [unclassified Xanthobacter]